MTVYLYPPLSKYKLVKRAKRGGKRQRKTWFIRKLNRKIDERYKEGSCKTET